MDTFEYDRFKVSTHGQNIGPSESPDNRFAMGQCPNRMSTPTLTRLSSLV